MWVGRRLGADQYIHCCKLARRVEFIAQLTRSSPYEEIRGYSFTKRLHKDLVVMPLDLEAVGIGYGERGHRLAKFENREMVQRGFNMADLALAGGLRARSGNRKSKGNRRERFHSGLLRRNVRLKKRKGEAEPEAQTSPSPARSAPGEWEHSCFRRADCASPCTERERPSFHIPGLPDWRFVRRGMLAVHRQTRHSHLRSSAFEPEPVGRQSPPRRHRPPP